MRPALLSAYRKTGYVAAGIEIRIGRRSAAMDRLLLSYKARAAVLITAYNPFSRVMPPGWNQRMQARLLQALRRRPVLPATGTFRQWSEDHLLVFGDPRPMYGLARSCRQNGIVMVRLRQPARLVIGFGVANRGENQRPPRQHAHRREGAPGCLREIGSGVTDRSRELLWR